MALTETQKDRAIALFKQRQDELAQAFERLDGAARLTRKSWAKEPNPSGQPSGGGTMGVLRGAVIEKAGANVSAVHGDKYPALEGADKDQPYFAGGISTICHGFNPHVPIAHMNVRLLEVGGKFWVGGGADLTPFMKYDDDTRDFHAALAGACEVMGPGTYEKYKAWCEEYFYIPHRKSQRGVGGIFFDYLEGDFDHLVDFIGAVSGAYVSIYPKIVARRKDLPYSPEDKEGQLYWRARYAEFNLVYDRGTKFGLMTGGNIEAIFVSMPPVVKW